MCILKPYVKKGILVYSDFMESPDKQIRIDVGRIKIHPYMFL